MENNALITLQQNPSKENINKLVESFRQQIDDGNMNPLSVAVSMAALETLVKELRAVISVYVMDKVSKYPKSKADHLGASVSLVDTIRHDFSHIEAWSDLEAVIVAARESQKRIEEEEKKWRRGELPVKSSSSTFKVQLPTK
jgi:hypothetical protein